MLKQICRMGKLDCKHMKVSIDNRASSFSLSDGPGMDGSTN